MTDKQIVKKEEGGFITRRVRQRKEALKSYAKSTLRQPIPKSEIDDFVSNITSACQNVGKGSLLTWQEWIARKKFTDAELCQKAVRNMVITSYVFMMGFILVSFNLMHGIGLLIGGGNIQIIQIVTLMLMMVISFNATLLFTREIFMTRYKRILTTTEFFLVVRKFPLKVLPRFISHEMAQEIVRQGSLKKTNTPGIEKDKAE